MFLRNFDALGENSALRKIKQLKRGLKKVKSSQKRSQKLKKPESHSTGKTLNFFVNF